MMVFRRVIRVLTGGKNDNTTNRGSRELKFGSFDHFTDAVDSIEHLKRERRHDKAEELLKWCITQTSGCFREIVYRPGARVNLYSFHRSVRRRSLINISILEIFQASLFLVVFPHHFAFSHESDL